MKISRTRNRCLLQNVNYIRVTLIVCSLLLKEATCIEDYPPDVFGEEPLRTSKNSGIVIPGQSKFVNCAANGQPAPLYHWMNNNKYVAYNKTDTTYIIKSQDLLKGQIYEFRCVAENYLGSIISRAAPLQINYMGDFPSTGQVKEIKVNVTGTVIIPLEQIDGVPEPRIKWYKILQGQGNITMRTEEPRSQVTLRKSLVLLQVEFSDTGTSYVAEALNTHYLEDSGTANRSFTAKYSITVNAGADTSLPFIAPKIVVPPEDQNANKGAERVDMECVATAKPLDRLRIYWYKVAGSTKTAIVHDQTKYVLSTATNRTLTIKQADVQDDGLYECEAVLLSDSGSPLPGIDIDSARANLTIFVSPQIPVSIESKYSRDFGQSITIPCSPTGIPPPQLHWYHNSEIVASLNDSRYTIHSNGSLSITGLDLEHSGMYQCFARNEAGETSRATWLRVSSSPPVFDVPPENVTVTEGNVATITCTVQGAPKPLVTWIKDDVAVPIGSGSRFQTIGGSLLVASAMPVDTGWYTCNATNLKGSISAEAYLQVYMKTQIDRPPQDMSVIRGNQASLQCGVSHDPLILVTWKWYHQAKTPAGSPFQEIIPDSRVLIFTNGSLHFKSVFRSDVGNYRCEVISNGGNDSRTVKLQVIESPGAPTVNSVILETGDPRAVRITWTAGYTGNTPILNYNIQYRIISQDAGGSSDQGGWTTYPEEIPASQTFAVVSNLKPARVYQFRVSATNEVGEGDLSDPKPDGGITMPQQPPSSPPKNFYGTSRSNRSITLSWKAPDQDNWNGILKGYMILYRLKKNLGFLQYNFSNPSVAPEFELEPLDIFSWYELKVAAYNDKGVGVYTSLIEVRTQEGRPSVPPTNLSLVSINSTCIQATWVPPEQLLLNGINLGYKVEARRVGQPQTEIVAVVPNNPDDPTGIQTTFLTNLQKYTEYSATVLCYTSKGDGPRSTMQTLRTDEDVPGLVGSLTFQDVRDKSIKVLWTPPTEVNGVLTGYRLRYQKKGNASSQKTLNQPSDTETITLYDLTPRTNYTISIAAKTQVGPGPSRSADVESGVPPERPGAPHKLGWTNVKARSVRLQFFPGFDGKTSITLWIVEAQEGEETEWKEIYTVSDPDATEIVVHNLRPYTWYKLRLIAENIVDRSDPSEATQPFQTLQDSPNSPPANLTVRAHNATALRVSWTPLSVRDWNGPPRGYRIFYSLTHEPGPIKVIELNDGMNLDAYMLTRLEEWMEYSVNMTAYNDVGMSAYSPTTVVRTHEAVPSSGPHGVRAVAQSSTSIMVSWGDVPLLDRNGMIQGYKVQYRSRAEGISPQMKTVTGNTTKNALLDDLRKYVQYEIRVLAYTRMGDGVLSSPEVTATTHEDFPGPPVIIWFPYVSYISAMVVWSPPLEPNGIITGYEVTYQLRDRNQPPVSSGPLSAQTRQYNTSTPLERETYYIFNVTARTQLGLGQTASVEVYTMIDRRPPDSPTKPSVSSSKIQPRSVTISWAHGFNGYGPLRNYTIQYKNENLAWVDVPEAIPPDVTTYTVEGLKPNTRYVFRVAATNDIGKSSWSVQSDEVQTLETNPEGAPTNITVKPLTRTSVSVTWEEPPRSTWNGDLVGYKVKYRQADASTDLEVNAPYPDRRRNLSNLEKFVNYEFRVIAYNNIGDGPSSVPVTVYVGDAAPSAPPQRIEPEVISSTEIRVRWEPPPPETQNGELSSYRVKYWIDGKPSSILEVFVLVPNHEVVLQNLEIFTRYAVTIQAKNLAGDGPDSGRHYAKTAEGVPSAPWNIQFWNVTLQSLEIAWEEPNKTNGIVLGYDLSYLQTTDDGIKKEFSQNVPGHVTLKEIVDLQGNNLYTFYVRARTSQGPGPGVNNTVVTGPQIGSPGPPSKPELTTGITAVTIAWQDGTEGEFPTFGYMVQKNIEGEEKWENQVVMYSGEHEVVISYSMLNPDQTYLFRVTALNKKGMSQFSPVSDAFRTPSPALPAAEARAFHYEWWFLVIVALGGCIVVLVIITLLCLVSRRRRGAKRKKHSTPGVPLGPIPVPEPEEGGFTGMEITRPKNTNRFAGIRNGSSRNASHYARSPPRPSPASVAYSDDDTVSKPPLRDDSSSDTTDKPSQYDSSDASDNESDLSSTKDFPPPPPPASPPPPPFPGPRNAYANEPGPSWQPQQNSSFNAYQYTDSEAESSHYALSLNGGQILMNNQAGSRAPLPGFSSFV